MKIKVKVGNEEVDGETMGFRIIGEPWSEYILDDGTILRHRATLHRIIKTDRKNEDGTEMTYEEHMDRRDLEYGDQFEDLRIEDRVPDWLRTRNGHGWQVDWVRVAQCAVRKESMLDDVAIILQMMALGVPSDQVFEMAEDEKERKAMQAAWRWVDRNWDSRIVHLFRRVCPPEAEPRIVRKPTKVQVDPVPAWEAIRRACERSRPKPEWGASPSGIED